MDQFAEFNTEWDFSSGQPVGVLDASFTFAGDGGQSGALGSTSGGPDLETILNNPAGDVNLDMLDNLPSVPPQLQDGYDFSVQAEAAAVAAALQTIAGNAAAAFTKTKEDSLILDMKTRGSLISFIDGRGTQTNASVRAEMTGPYVLVAEENETQAQGDVKMLKFTSVKGAKGESYDLFKQMLQNRVGRSRKATDRGFDVPNQAVGNTLFNLGKILDNQTTLNLDQKFACLKAALYLLWHFPKCWISRNDAEKIEQALARLNGTGSMPTFPGYVAPGANVLFNYNVTYKDDYTIPADALVLAFLLLIRYTRRTLIASSAATKTGRRKDKTSFLDYGVSLVHWNVGVPLPEKTAEFRDAQSKRPQIAVLPGVLLSYGVKNIRLDEVTRGPKAPSMDLVVACRVADFYVSTIGLAENIVPWLQQNAQAIEQRVAGVADISVESDFVAYTTTLPALGPALVADLVDNLVLTQPVLYSASQESPAPAFVPVLQQPAAAAPAPAPVSAQQLDDVLDFLNNERNAAAASDSTPPAATGSRTPNGVPDFISSPQPPSPLGSAPPQFGPDNPALSASRILEDFIAESGLDALSPRPTADLERSHSSSLERAASQDTPAQTVEIALDQQLADVAVSGGLPRVQYEMAQEDAALWKSLVPQVDAAAPPSRSGGNPGLEDAKLVIESPAILAAAVKFIREDDQVTDLVEQIETVKDQFGKSSVAGNVRNEPEISTAKALETDLQKLCLAYSKARMEQSQSNRGLCTRRSNETKAAATFEDLRSTLSAFSKGRLVLEKSEPKSENYKIWWNFAAFEDHSIDTDVQTVFLNENPMAEACVYAKRCRLCCVQLHPPKQKVYWCMHCIKNNQSNWLYCSEQCRARDAVTHVAWGECDLRKEFDVTERVKEMALALNESAKTQLEFIDYIAATAMLAFRLMAKRGMRTMLERKLGTGRGAAVQRRRRMAHEFGIYDPLVFYSGLENMDAVKAATCMLISALLFKGVFTCKKTSEIYRDTAFEDVIAMTAVAMSNSFSGCPAADVTDGRPTAAYSILPITSFFDHSCAPDLNMTIALQPPYGTPAASTIKLFASTRIATLATFSLARSAAGLMGHLRIPATLSYILLAVDKGPVSGFLGKGLSQRRIELDTSKEFHCKCARCRVDDIVVKTNGFVRRKTANFGENGVQRIKLADVEFYGVGKYDLGTLAWFVKTPEASERLNTALTALCDSEFSESTHKAVLAQITRNVDRRFPEFREDAYFQLNPTLRAAEAAGDGSCGYYSFAAAHNNFYVHQGKTPGHRFALQTNGQNAFSLLPNELKDMRAQAIAWVIGAFSVYANVPETIRNVVIANTKKEGTDATSWQTDLTLWAQKHAQPDEWADRLILLALCGVFSGGQYYIKIIDFSKPFVENQDDDISPKVYFGKEREPAVIRIVYRNDNHFDPILYTTEKTK